MIRMQGKGAVHIMHAKGSYRPDNEGFITVPPELEETLTKMGFVRADVAPQTSAPVEEPEPEAEAPALVSDPDPVTDPAVVGSIDEPVVESTAVLETEAPSAETSDADRQAAEDLVTELVAGGMPEAEARALVSDQAKS